MNDVTAPVEFEQAYSVPLSPEQNLQIQLTGQDAKIFRALAIVAQVTGDLDLDCLQRAARNVLAEQQILAHRVIEQSAYRGLRQSAELQVEPWTLHNVGELSWQAFEEEVSQARENGFARSDAWLSKLMVAQTEEQAYGIALVLADVITDLGGLSLFMDELMLAYQDDSSVDEDDERPQYEDYIEWRAEVAEDEDASSGQAYWQNHLKSADQAPALPCRRATKQVLNAPVEISTVQVDVETALQNAVQQLAESLDKPLVTTLQAAWWWLQARISGQHQLLVGWNHDCCEDYDVFSESMGLFEKVLPLALNVSPEQSFAHWLDAIDSTLEEHTTWQEYWSVDAPATQFHYACGFSVQKQLDETSSEVDSTEWSIKAMQGIALPFELSLNVGVQDEQLKSLQIAYQSQAYTAADAEVLLKQYCALLESLVKDADVAMSNACYIGKGEAELYQLLENPQASTDVELVLLPQKMATWAVETPDATALSYGDSGAKLSYAELETAVVALAQRLREQGVSANSVVALVLPRSIELIVSILAVWRVGAAWTPVDMQWPAKRKEKVLTAAQAALVISDSASWQDSTETSPVLLLDKENAQTDQADVVSGSDDLAALTPEQTAYIIFTSGSTGTPKGVVIEHKQLSHYMSAVNQALALSECQHFAMTSTVAADLGHTTLFAALYNGATLHIANDDEIQDGARFAQFVQSNGIDCLKIVPSHLSALLDSAQETNGESLALPQTIILGGEAISPNLVDSILQMQPDCHLFNHYGPTEATVGVLYSRVQSSDIALNGIPLSDAFVTSRVVILDDKLQPVPMGVLGDVYIGGEQLCRGYLQAEDADNNSPFVDDPAQPGSRLYHSGDLGRYLPDGRLMLSGRRDHQVKVRGFRIELGEVEQALLNDAEVAQTAVIRWQSGPADDGDSAQLVAYVQADKPVKDEVLDAWLQALITRLSEQLPTFMLPAHIFSLDWMPRLANGKIDRQNLPDPNEFLVAKEYVAPKSALETVLAEEMAALLKLEKVSTQDSFFNLGGHSLLVIKLVSRLRKELKIDIQPGVIFDNPSVVQLAEALSNDAQTSGGQDAVAKLERTAQICLKLNSMTPEQREALLAKMSQ